MSRDDNGSVKNGRQLGNSKCTGLQKKKHTEKEKECRRGLTVVLLNLMSR